MYRWIQLRAGGSGGQPLVPGVLGLSAGAASVELGRRDRCRTSGAGHQAILARVELPDPALVVLVGAAGAGKSTWAATHYRHAETVSSDALRERVGTGPADLDATTDAFAVLEAIVAARLRR